MLLCVQTSAEEKTSEAQTLAKAKATVVKRANLGSAMLDQQFSPYDELGSGPFIRPANISWQPALIPIMTTLKMSPGAVSQQGEKRLKQLKALVQYNLAEARRVLIKVQLAPDSANREKDAEKLKRDIQTMERFIAIRTLQTKFTEAKEKQKQSLNN